MWSSVVVQEDWSVSVNQSRLLDLFLKVSFVFNRAYSFLQPDTTSAPFQLNILMSIYVRWINPSLLRSVYHELRPSMKAHRSTCIHSYCHFSNFVPWLFCWLFSLFSDSFLVLSSFLNQPMCMFVVLTTSVVLPDSERASLLQAPEPQVGLLHSISSFFLLHQTTPNFEAGFQINEVLILSWCNLNSVKLYCVQ